MLHPMNNRLYTEILSHQDPSQVEGLSRFFKTGKGQYGEGDRFLGIKVPVTREVVKQCWQTTSFDDLETCIRSEYHELRLAALLALVQLFKHAKKDVGQQKQCVDFYLSHTEFINNWDLVDLSCYELLGVWLLDKERALLYDLDRTSIFRRFLPAGRLQLVNIPPARRLILMPDVRSVKNGLRIILLDLPEKLQIIC